MVEDDSTQLNLVRRALISAGYEVMAFGDGEAAAAALEVSEFDAAVVDWKLPGRDGLDLLELVREKRPEAAFVMVTAYGTIAHAVQAVQAGADDYLAKPFERPALLLAVEKALRSRRLEGENRRLSAELGERDRLVDLVGKAPAMQKLFRRVEKIAGTEATVLLTGESGTGKELAARALHTLSHRAGGPFVAVNCAAIPEGILETELFGAERGAYTGAHRDRVGKFAAAKGGTLFLDEIGELPLASQPKLLRVLQEGALTRVGGHEELKIDVRVIAATNRNLATDAAEGRFREDLYYRLAVVPIELPPLRDRRDDIPALVDHFVRANCRRHKVEIRAFPKAILKRFMDYPWPGNVRELSNVVERLMLLAENETVHSDDLPPSFGDRAPTGRFALPPEGIAWDEVEADLLSQAMELAAGNRAQAARLLGLSYKAFLYRLEKRHEDLPK